MESCHPCSEVSHRNKKQPAKWRAAFIIKCMDIDNPVIQLCLQGARAELEHRLDDARQFYLQAWEAQADDYDACIAAHYVARFQETPEETLRWNQLALQHADKVLDGRATDFYPSLYLNLGKSYEDLSDLIRSKIYYQLAAELGVEHQPD